MCEVDAKDEHLWSDYEALPPYELNPYTVKSEVCYAYQK